MRSFRLRAGGRSGPVCSGTRTGAAALGLAVLATTGCQMRSGAEPPAPGDGSARAAPAAVRVLHVEPRGDRDGSGARDDPFGSLASALPQLRAGDTLLLAGGTYEERIDAELAPGRADAPIRVQAEGDEQPLLRGLLWLEEPTWWRIEGLDVSWDDESASDEHMVKVTGGQDWVLSDAEIWGARSYAAVLVAGEPERFTLRRLHVHDTRSTNGTNEDHLIYLNSGSGGGVVEQCLLVGSPNGRAIKVGPADEDGPAVENLTIRYNTMIDNRGPSNVQFAWDSGANLVYRNIMLGAAPDRPNVTTFDLSGTGNTVRDNIGAGSTAVLEPRTEGLVDGGGNLRIDPQLVEAEELPYVPARPEAAGYGYAAPAARAEEELTGDIEGGDRG